MQFAIDGEHGDGNFQHDGVDVVSAHGVGGIVMGVVSVDGGRKYWSDSAAEVQRIESRAQIDEERIIGGSGPDSHAAGQSVDSLLEERLVVGHGLRTHIGGHCIQRLAGVQNLRLFVLDHDYGVVLAQAETFRTCASQCGDGRNAGDAAGESGEQVGLTNLGIEAKLEGNVIQSVLIVVNVHLVKHVGVEGEIVGSVGGFEQRVNIQDECNLGGIVITNKSVPVGDIGGTIQ